MEFNFTRNEAFTDKMTAVNKKVTVEAFRAGEEADEKGRKAAKLNKKPDKTKEEEELIRTLQEQTRIARERQNALNHMAQRSGLGEKILRAYFTYKMASLACHTLTAMTVGGLHRDASAGIGAAFTGGVDKFAQAAADYITGKDQAGADKEIMSVQEMEAARAQQIEDCLESFERMSDEAEELGITEPGKPLLSDKDKEQIHDLAEISRNGCTPEEYAQKCADLGLDYNEAYQAANADRERDQINARENDKRRDLGDDAGRDIDR